MHTKQPSQPLPDPSRAAVEAELGRSLVVLDLCNGMRDSFMELKLTVQELLLALRRGEGVSSQVKAYVRLANKVQKQFKKISKKTASDKNDSRVVMLMAEASHFAARIHILNLVEAS